MATDVTLRCAEAADPHQDRGEGRIDGDTEFRPGLFLNADPALQLSGQWRSPPGRLLELDVQTEGTGAWVVLHLVLNAPNLSDYSWVGFACRSAAPETLMIRPCLRSGTEDGFTDCFFDKHILTVSEARNHVDALHLETSRCIPRTASWRELVLFLPRQNVRWDLHDLRVFLA